MSSRISALALVLVASMAFTACGGDGSSSKDASSSDTTTTETATTDTTETSGGGDAAAAQVLELKNKGSELAFDKATLTATAGKVTIRLTNDGSIPHNIAVKDASGAMVGSAGEMVTGGDTSETTVDLKAGTYEYYCEPHESSGMKGTLAVS